MKTSKIELTCTNCQSILRVDAEYAGKQAKCPVCNHLSVIPSAAPAASDAEQPDDIRAAESPGRPESPAATESHQVPMASRGRELPYHPLATGSPQANPYYPSNLPQVQTRDPDNYGVASLVIGIVGLISLFSCGCAAVPVLPCAGLALGLKSSSPIRTAGIIVNAIALGMWLLAVLFMALMMVFR